MDTNSPDSAHRAPRTQPESLRARAISPSLTVRDLEASLRWYCVVLGFVVGRRHERDGKLRAVSLKAGAVEILINQDDGAKGTDRVKGEGFSLQLTTAQNLDDIAARITAAGGILESPPADMPWGVRMFRLKDPDGFRWVVSSERAS